MTQAPCVACSPPHEAGAPGVLEGQVCSLHLDPQAPLPTFQLLAFRRHREKAKEGSSSSLRSPPQPQLEAMPVCTCSTTPRGH